MKKNFWITFILAILLVACGQDHDGFECKDGICIDINIIDPIQASEPVSFKFSIKTEKDISDLSIGLLLFPGITLYDIEAVPNSVKLVHQEKNSVSWHIDTIGGEKYIISGHILLAKPSASYGIFTYTLIAYFNQPSFGRITDSIVIFLDAEGNRVEDSQAKTLMETEWPLPTIPPDQTVVIHTSYPSITPPPDTPTPSLTPVLFTPTPTNTAFPYP